MIKFLLIAGFILLNFSSFGQHCSVHSPKNHSKIEQAKLNAMLVSMRASLKETKSVKKKLQKSNSYRGNTKTVIEQSIIHHEAEIQRLLDKISE